MDWRADRYWPLLPDFNPSGRRSGRSLCAGLCARKSALLSDPGAMVGGMSRPRTFDEKRVATAIRLPESVHHRLRQAAIDRDVSANLLVTRAVCDYLDRLCKADDALTVGRSAKSRASR